MSSTTSLPDPDSFEISLHEAAQHYQQAESPVRFIDVRELDEWDIAHLEKATLIPLSQFVEKAPALMPSKEVPCFVYCHHGMRSLRAVHWLRHQGWTQTWSVQGGIDAWSRQIDESVPLY